MLFVLLAFHFWHFCSSSPIPKEREVWIHDGTNVSICCSIQPNPGVDALFIFVNKNRFGALIGGPPNVRRIDSRDQTSREELPQWQLDSIDKQDTSLCVHNPNGAGLSLQKSTEVKCEVTTDQGLGQISQEELITVKVYVPVAIHANPEPTTVVEGETSVLTCEATGSPGLHLQWKAKNSDIILNETQPDQNNQGGSQKQLDLFIFDVKAKQHGEVYVCEASTSYPTDAVPAKAEFTLDVALPPTMSASKLIVYTNFNASEEVNVTVTGYPVPAVQCEDLRLDDGIQVATEPQGGVMLYRLQVPSIQQIHLHRYTCRAENPFGVATLPVEFTVAPSDPVVLSPSQTKYADYYLLKWRTLSGAPLVNATLNIEEFTGDESSGSLYPRSAQNKTVVGHRTQTVALGLHELDRMRVDVWPSPDAQILDSSPENNSEYQAERERTVWYHLTNLSANTEHHLTVTVCNEYACEVSKPHVFSTLGDETVDATVLRLSPKDAEMITGQLIQEASVGYNLSPNLRSGIVDCLLVTIGIPLLVLHLTQMVY